MPPSQSPTPLHTSDAYFDSIRPALDHEVPELLSRLISEPEVAPILEAIAPGRTRSEWMAIADSIHSVLDFKLQVVRPAVMQISSTSLFALTSSGKSGLQESGHSHFTFISNHRDIILDSAYLNVECANAGLFPPRIAIGDNLLLRPWIQDLVRLCDAFIVKRTPSIREALEESRRLSAYIRLSVTSGEASVWIAQREGRAKDANDRTLSALLKMLAMSADAPTDLPTALGALHIVPTAITYEYDPCDYLKAAELLARANGQTYTKAPMEDYHSMRTGITGTKGRVHIAMGTPLTPEHIAAILQQQSQPRLKPLELIAAAIDREIYARYRFYPSNYIAYDLTYGTRDFKQMYSQKERLEFELYIEHQIDKLPASVAKERAQLRHIMLQMYATPLHNHLTHAITH